jgi:hypothetical protein
MVKYRGVVLARPRAKVAEEVCSEGRLPEPIPGGDSLFRGCRTRSVRSSACLGTRWRDVLARCILCNELAGNTLAGAQTTPLATLVLALPGTVDISMALVVTVKVALFLRLGDEDGADLDHTPVLTGRSSGDGRDGRALASLLDSGRWKGEGLHHEDPAPEIGIVRMRPHPIYDVFT